MTNLRFTASVCIPSEKADQATSRQIVAKEGNRGRWFSKHNFHQLLLYIVPSVIFLLNCATLLKFSRKQSVSSLLVEGLKKITSTTIATIMLRNYSQLI